MWRDLGCAGALVMMAASARAAEIKFLDVPGAVGFVSIQGEIIDGDGNRFRELKQRSACGENGSCLHQSYDSRLLLMKAVDVGQTAKGG